MQNKFFSSRLNTVLLLILIGLFGATIYLIKQNKIPSIFDKSPGDFNCEAVQNDMYPGIKIDDTVAWERSPKLGLCYPEIPGEDMKVLMVESDYHDLFLSESGKDGLRDPIPYFQVVFSNNFYLRYGGIASDSFCDSPNWFGDFTYGVSTVACVDGLKASITAESVQPLTSEAKKIFGDFVIKNNTRIYAK